MRSIPHDDNLQVPEPPRNGLAFLEQMYCEGASSRETIQLSSDNQDSHRRGLPIQNDLITKN